MEEEVAEISMYKHPTHTILPSPRKKNHDATTTVVIVLLVLDLAKREKKAWVVLFLIFLPHSL